MRHPRALALVLAAALLLPSCGDDDDGEDAATTTDPASASTSAAPAPEPTSTGGAKEEQATAAVLQATDFPPGWKVHEPGQGVDVEVIWRKVIGCLGIETGPPLGTATSPTYVRGLATQAQSTVEYMSQASAEATATGLGGPKFNNCARDALSSDAARAHEGAQTGEVEVSALDFPELGRSTSATRVEVTLNLPERQVPIFQDLIVVFDDDSVTRVVFLNPLEPFPPDLQRSLVEKVVSRA